MADLLKISNQAVNLLSEELIPHKFIQLISSIDFHSKQQSLLFLFSVTPFWFNLDNTSRYIARNNLFYTSYVKSVPYYSQIP